LLKLPGIFASIATPFDHKGDIYKVKVRHNVEKWNMVKLAGYLVCGSTGEGVALTADEKLMLWSLTAEVNAGGRVLLAGTGTESVRETVALSNQAAGLGYQGAVVRTPHYYKNLVDTPEAQELYFRAVADQSRIPVIVYNWPQATGVDLAAESVARLSEHPNIIALLENSGNLEKAARVIREAKKGFQVLTGSASTLWSSLDQGAGGAILGFASAAPYACITIWEAHRMREREAAADWQNRIDQAVKLVTARYGIPGLKYAMDLNGYYGGPCRLPLGPLPLAAKAEIELAFDGIRG
jgi:4-hydroxy-2-oxoglutarate aldolase